jgi:hypothetical protein
MTDAPSGLIDRMRGAALLRNATYEELEADPSATAQAGTVVALVAVASALGAWGHGIFNLLAATASALLGWLVTSAAAFIVGTKLFRGRATWGELLRTIGFAQSPGILYVFALVPIVDVVIRAALFVWIIVASVIAIRQALDVSTPRAVLTAAIAAPILLLLASFIGWRTHLVIPS